jgi:hypothetical protein
MERGEEHGGRRPELRQARQYTVIASHTLVADGLYCDYDPIKRKADIGSSFVEHD